MKRAIYHLYLWRKSFITDPSSTILEHPYREKEVVLVNVDINMGSMGSTTLVCNYTSGCTANFGRGTVKYFTIVSIFVQGQKVQLN